MPAYNEEANIRETVEQWYSLVSKINIWAEKATLVIANDGSKDNTWGIMQQLMTEYPDFVALDKPNSGHGATVLYLYRYALEQGADYIFQTDSDGQTNPEEFWSMWENRKSYDFQIGYRKDRQKSFYSIYYEYNS